MIVNSQFAQKIMMKYNVSSILQQQMLDSQRIFVSWTIHYSLLSQRCHHLFSIHLQQYLQIHLEQEVEMITLQLHQLRKSRFNVMSLISISSSSIMQIMILIYQLMTLKEDRKKMNSQQGFRNLQKWVASLCTHHQDASATLWVLLTISASGT